MELRGHSLLAISLSKLTLRSPELEQNGRAQCYILRIMPRRVSSDDLPAYGQCPDHRFPVHDRRQECRRRLLDIGLIAPGCGMPRPARPMADASWAASPCFFPEGFNFRYSALLHT